MNKISDIRPTPILETVKIEATVLCNSGVLAAERQKLSLVVLTGGEKGAIPSCKPLVHMFLEQLLGF